MLAKKRGAILHTALMEMHHENKNDRYLSGGLDWCSEFVSYVYKEAGHPFTGGSYSPRIEAPDDDGDWMLRSSNKIIKWFQERGHYHARGGTTWKTVEPKCGDYLFIGRAGSDRMHSGIVWYSDHFEDLWTIEGNNARRPVSIYKYPRWRENDKINGPANGIIMGIGVLI